MIRGVSQKALGIAAGIDEFSASTRVNRYELGIHEPNIGTARVLAAALRVPAAYLYAEDDELAEAILRFSSLGAPDRRQVLMTLRGLTEKNDEDFANADTAQYSKNGL